MDRRTLNQLLETERAVVEDLRAHAYWPSCHAADPLAWVEGRDARSNLEDALGLTTSAHGEGGRPILSRENVLFGVGHARALRERELMLHTLELMLEHADG